MSISLQASCQSLKRRQSSVRDDFKGTDQEILQALHQDLEGEVAPTALHPGLIFGIGSVCLLNIGLLLSLPPVLRGKGAPYLPTLKTRVDTMFSVLRKEPNLVRRMKQAEDLRFADLGSGDGRLVFRAARENIFQKSIGYEINPLLHAWAQSRRLLQPRYWAATEIHLQDLWTIDLSTLDVVAVYGLHPIMQDLGEKMKVELRPGSLVLSNAFPIPGWKPSPFSIDGVYVYSIPACWDTSAALPSALLKKQ